MRNIDERTGAGAPRLPCVKGAGKNLRFLTEGLSKCVNGSTQKDGSSDPLSPSVRTGAAQIRV